MAAPLKLSSWPEDHEKPFPVFRQPTILGHFSLNGERQFLPDISGLQYIIPDVLRPEGKRVSLDLNKGVRKAIRLVRTYSIQTTMKQSVLAIVLAIFFFD